MVRTAALIFAVALSGCSQPAGSELKWGKAPGGGVVAFEPQSEARSMAVRCFEIDGVDRCLIATELDGTSMSFQVVDRSEIGQSLSARYDGFECMHLLGLATSQSVLKDGETLMSASAPVLGRASLPPAMETREYMRLNVPNAPAKYFDCKKVADVFSNGSIATAATTSITPDLLK